MLLQLILCIYGYEEKNENFKNNNKIILKICLKYTNFSKLQYLFQFDKEKRQALLKLYCWKYNNMLFK